VASGTSPSRLPQLLDIAGIAEHLGVTERHVRRLIAERRIPFLKWGHLIRFDPDEVASWLENARVPARRTPVCARRTPQRHHSPRA
jgi:excisionase family DNA binding protein